MSQSRRLFLRAAALTLPALACTAAIASAAERPDTDPLAGDILKRDGRATCPLCQPGHPCADHLF